MLKTKRYNFRAESEFAESIEDAWKSMGFKNMSSFIRYAALKEAGIIEKFQSGSKKKKDMPRATEMRKRGDKPAFSLTTLSEVSNEEQAPKIRNIDWQNLSVSVRKAIVDEYRKRRKGLTFDTKYQNYFEFLDNHM